MHSIYSQFKFTVETIHTLSSPCSCRTMNLATNQIRTSLLAILLWVVGATMAAQDDRWNDEDQSYLLESIDNSQEVQEALLKMHFAALPESRVKLDGHSSDANITMDMSRADFETMVVKINTEVALLRSQALILSRAYKDLMVKHKNTFRELNTLKVNAPNTVSDYNGNFPYQPQKPSATCPNQPPPVCNCNCSPSYSETVTGNKYYYYYVLPKNDSGEIPGPPWEPQGHKNPSPPNYHQPSPVPSASSSYRPTRVDLDDPDPVELPRPWSIKEPPVKPAKASSTPRPTTMSLDSKFADLQSIVHRLDHITDKWKQSDVIDPWKSNEWYEGESKD